MLVRRLTIQWLGVAAATLFCGALVLGVPEGGSGARGDIWSSTVGHFLIKWTSDNIVIVRDDQQLQPVLSFKTIARADWDALVRQTPDRSLEGETTYRILSVVGPFLSLEEGNYCDCGGAHPTAHKGFLAIDLSKSKKNQLAPVSLSSIFSEKDINSALRSNELVARALKNSDATMASSLESLVKALEFKPVEVGECSYYFGNDLLSNFAFYSTEADRVVVAIGLSHAVEVCRGQMTQIRIRLPIPKATQAELEEAKQRTAGFLMVDAKQVSGDASTVIQFSTKVPDHGATASKGKQVK